MKKMLATVCISLVLSLCLACGEEEATDWIDDPNVALDDEYGKPMLGETQDVGKGDSATGSKLLPVSVDDSSTQVWEVRNQWADSDTAEAAKEGMAWPADSGLTWEQKYQAWVKQMEPAESTEGYSTYTTFTLLTPYGKALLSPRLECAETAIFARATFASWYHLPFVMSAWDPSDGSVHFGHFGIRSKSGKYRNSPNFKNAYADHEGTSAADYTAAWPTDSKLRKRKLSSNGDDQNTFLCEEGCFAGAYFDEIFLNKRTGHFLVWLLTYTGSMHLASSDNAYHIQPEAVAEGDVLLERWQKKGIGHTLLVKKVDHLEGGKIGADLASGSMPRRQPKWEDAATSKSYFTNDYCGGVGSSDDGDEYAKLGGGLKRFRTPVIKNGYWYNVVPDAYQEFWIRDSETEFIAARIAKFEELLGSLSPEEHKQLLLQKIEEKRLHLRNYPASCSARIAREDAFNELYALMAQHFGTDKEGVDKAHRNYEDYVFAELEYSKSKTCCWNQTTPAMYEIVMAYNVAGFEAAEQCVDPEVFKASNGGYQIFKDYAVSLGRGDEWVAWSEDEACAQKNVTNDTEVEHVWTLFCTIKDFVYGDATFDPCADEFSDNHDSNSAAEINVGTWTELKLCGETTDWFVITTEGLGYVIKTEFSHSAGDVDLYLYDAELTEIDTSTGMADSESVKIPVGTGTYYVEVKLLNGQSQSYSITVSE